MIDYGAKIKFHSMLSKKTQDGVTAPCGRSSERPNIIRCAKVQLNGEKPKLMCKTCSEALRFGRGKGRKRKGAKR